MTLRNGLLLSLPALLSCGDPCGSQPELRSFGGPRQVCRSGAETTEPDPTTSSDITTDTTTTTGCETDLCIETCSNGVQDPDEECDDGNDIDDDGCTNACTLPKCGDDIVQQGELCDDGPLNLPPYTTPAPPASACSENCDRTFEYCGDGAPNGPELCDDGVNGIPTQTASCEANCTIPACGDSIPNALVQPPEQCDNGTNNDPPYSQCDDGVNGTPTQTAACETTCNTPFCGDGITNPLAMPPEQCDDGKNGDGDGCSDTCLAERFVFVSPHRLFGDLSPGDPNFPMLDDTLTGIARADAYCTAIANDPTYKAWLSDSTTHPAMRFVAARNDFSGLYRLLKTPDFSIIATSWDDLTNGTLANPINVDFNGAIIVTTSNVWTHTLPRRHPR
jgi:cysteine-rich repeat protein